MKSLKLPWINLILAPFWFLFIIVGLSAYFYSTGISEENIESQITANIPLIIFLVQLMLLATLLVSVKKDGFNLFAQGWKLNNQIIKHVLSGIATGIALAFLYFIALSPLQLFLQKTLGDYIPPGETINSLGNQTIIFFIANVLLAPFVEENLYRNYTLTRFLSSYSLNKAVFITSIMFGLLHWVGGLWYIIITGLFIGIPFGYIAAKNRNIIFVFVAHFTLNLLEFIYITYTLRVLR